MIALTAQQIVLWCCAGLLIWAAVSDMQRFIIPDKISLGLIALYPIYLVSGLVGGAAVDWLGGLLAAAGMFAAGFVLFSLRLFGGGDVKLLSAVALYAGAQWVLPLIAVTAIAGGVLSIGILAAKMISLNRIPANLRGIMMPVESRFPVLRAALQTQAPYGAAIAFGGLFIIYQLVRV